MHLVIGMLASTLLARGRFGKNARTFWGVLELRHEIPGRIRLHCPTVKGSDQAAQSVERELPRLPGITEVSASSHSGSIVVHHDSDRIDVATIELGILKLLGLEEAADRPAPSVLARETDEVLDSVNKALLELSRGAVDIEFLVPTILMGLATYRMATKTKTGLPEAFTMFWWSFTWITRRLRAE